MRVPQIVTVVPKEFNAQNGNREWEKTVMDNTRVVTADYLSGRPGITHLRYG